MLACPLPPDEALRQQALDDMALVDTPAEHYLDALVELARETFGVKTVLISLIDHDRQWFKARIGLDAEQTPRDLSFCGHAILASEPLMVTDASRDPRFHDNPLVTGPPFIRFYAGEPLHASNGQAIGTLCLIDPSPRLLDLREGRQLNRLSILAEGYLQLRSLTEHTRFLRQEIDREQRKSLLAPPSPNCGTGPASTRCTSMNWSWRGPATSASASSTAISTISNVSTTPWGTGPATASSARRLRDCARRCGRKISWRVSAARSSWRWSGSARPRN